MDQLFLLSIFLFLLALAIVTAVLRWTFRVNEKFNQNAEIIRLLKKLAGEYDDEPESDNRTNGTDELLNRLNKENKLYPDRN